MKAWLWLVEAEGGTCFVSPPVPIATSVYRENFHEESFSGGFYFLLKHYLFRSLVIIEDQNKLCRVQDNVSEFTTNAGPEMMDLDLPESPCSPQGSDLSDLFEPPVASKTMLTTKKRSMYQATSQ